MDRRLQLQQRWGAFAACRRWGEAGFASFSRPAAILSVDHESSSRTSTCGSPPSAVTAASIWVRIASSAGQPMNVGVNSIRTRCDSTSTDLTTPRSTTR